MKPGERIELARRMWLAWMKRDLAALFECVADDVAWYPAGNFKNPWRGKEGIRAAAERESLFPNGQEAEFHHFYEAGTTVIAEATHRGRAFNGRAYENDACMVWEIPGEKIQCLRVYTDLTKVVELTR
jgi:ketosteroid isomerase-like protein